MVVSAGMAHTNWMMQNGAEELVELTRGGWMI